MWNYFSYILLRHTRDIYIFISILNQHENCINYYLRYYPKGIYKPLRAVVSFREQNSWLFLLVNCLVIYYQEDNKKKNIFNIIKTKQKNI